MITTWKEMTIDDQLIIQDIGGLQMASEDEKNMMVAAHLAGIPYERFLLMPLEDVRKYMDNAAFLMDKPQAIKERRKYEVDGRTYKLLRDVSEMTVAQFIDFQNIYHEGFAKYPREMLAIFLVPEGHEYNDGYDKQQQIDDMGKIGVEEALGICDFFTRRCTRSIRRMRRYLMVMMDAQRLMAPKQQKEMMKALKLETSLIMEELEDMFGLTV